MAIIRTSILVIIMVQLFLLVAAYPLAPPASVGSRDGGGFPAADRRRISADVVGDMEKPILWRRMMRATSPHKSPSAPHNFPHQPGSLNGRRLSGTSSEHVDRRPPSPATKTSGMGGAGDDDGMTKMKEEVISSCGGKQNHDEYAGVVARRCRRWRRLIAASETGPHKSPSAPHSFRHQRRLSGTSSEHEDCRPPSPATNNSGMGGARDDDGMTKMKEEIISGCGGNHNPSEYGVVARRCRRWRMLIGAGASDSPPSSGYHRH
nr:uncharacterized protein LOC109186351 isoform X1 [Ipomoea batatas]GMD93175.1 uncharacterized protein LOC109186351 isoform X1 [Ipomoea batatas]GME01051.1 uncharacterized protein LOC109186351 isoform X1 [Ipomoea batatas]